MAETRGVILMLAKDNFQICPLDHWSSLIILLLRAAVGPLMHLFISWAVFSSTKPIRHFLTLRPDCDHVGQTQNDCRWIYSQSHQIPTWDLQPFWSFQCKEVHLYHRAKYNTRQLERLPRPWSTNISRTKVAADGEGTHSPPWMIIERHRRFNIVYGHS